LISAILARDTTVRYGTGTDMAMKSAGVTLVKGTGLHVNPKDGSHPVHPGSGRRCGMMVFNVAMAP
jgi:hypothetical protein